MKRKPDIIWIIIDGVRPDRLRSCGNTARPFLFIDEILCRGALFNCVIAAGTNSKTSMHSAFSALNPSVHRMNAYDPDLQINFDLRALTITDILRFNGYKTFRYVDAVQYEDFYDLQQVVPAGGFNVWESGGYALLKDTPKHSFSTEQRFSFIERFNKCEGPKFAYIHLLTSHEIYPERVKDCTWTSEIYEQGLLDVSDDFEQLWHSLDIDDNSLIAVATDHGVRLDCHLVRDLAENGINLRDQSCRTFCSFIGSGVSSANIGRMVRNIDIAPTLLDLAGLGPMQGQGISLVPLLNGEDIPPLYAFTEGVGSYEIPRGEPRVANIWGVRTEKWKFWTHKTRGDSLFDLENDPEERNNLIGTGVPIEAELRQLVASELIGQPRSVLQIYGENAAQPGMQQLLRREDIQPEVSIFILAGWGDGFPDEAVRNIRGQLAVYWDLCVIRFKGRGVPSPPRQFHGDFRIRYEDADTLQSLMSLIVQAKGEYLLFLQGDTILEPLALYRLKEIMHGDARIVSSSCSVAHAVHFLGKTRVFQIDHASRFGKDQGHMVMSSLDGLKHLEFSAGNDSLAVRIKENGKSEALFRDDRLATLYLKPGLLRRFWLIYVILFRMTAGFARKVAGRLMAIIK